MREGYRYFETHDAARASALVLEEDVARARHDAGKKYVVAARLADATSCVIQLNARRGSIEVGFPDASGRDTVGYAFRRERGDRVFLYHAIYCIYADDITPVRSESYTFKPNGQVTIRIEYHQSKQVREGVTKVALLSNYEEWPRFGDYRRYEVRERV